MASPNSRILDGLNDRQAEAVLHDNSALLVASGPGTGKTRTLVHRVAHLIERGVDPGRILLLTFTRRTAAEMRQRVDRLIGGLDHSPLKKPSSSGRKVWAGTFHAVAAQLLRMHGKSFGLNPSFTILDRADSEDLLDVARTELELADKNKLFPKKGTCIAIYSLVVNSTEPLETVLNKQFPWCQDYSEDLRRLFRAYADSKENSHVLDYDDLLLFWRNMLSANGQRVRDRFDCVLVDEYQDTNLLQAEILQLLCPDGTGLTVVGDDDQSIYSFRAATVRNMLTFPKQFPGAQVVTLEHSYRSTQPILDATNAVIMHANERYTKRLFSERKGGVQPQLVACPDEFAQAEFLVREILQHREEGIDLHAQAVLFRASHNSDILEIELARHNIPFVKYGGRKFVEAAHVKDLMAFLRLAENPRDLVAGTRALKLLSGIGAKTARQLMSALLQAAGNFHAWSRVRVPEAASGRWPKLVQLMQRLTGEQVPPLPGQIMAVKEFYLPLLEENYDNTESRRRDLEQLELLSSRFSDRRTMLAEFALDPPQTADTIGGSSDGNDDCLVLSTIHSAKGLEWRVVYVMSANDGSIPSSRAVATTEQVEEERRLFYVALTRAKDWLYVSFPQRCYLAYRGGSGHPSGHSQLTRFLTKDVQPMFQQVAAASPVIPENSESIAGGHLQLRGRARAMWN